MLQQTRVQTVIPYYEKFIIRFPDVIHLAQANLQEVLKMWEGLGYYARARNLLKAACVLIQENSGIIPDDFKTFQKLPGVGEYIAAAFLSIAFGKTYAAVDGNVKRVLSRLKKINQSVSHKYYTDAAKKLMSKNYPGKFNQAMMELGALICTSKDPACSKCPLQQFCQAFHSNTVNKYPRRIKSPKVPHYHMTAGIVYRDDHILITQRKPEGLLGGLWEFPSDKIKDGETAEAACVRQIADAVNLSVKTIIQITRIKHAYTHFRITLEVFHCQYLGGTIRLRGPINYKWIRLCDIPTYPFPAANYKFIPLLREPTMLLDEKVY
jgi:A/G-specific adenine glycosylase